MGKKQRAKLINNKPLIFIYNFFKAIIYAVLILFLVIILIPKITNNNLSLAGIRIYNVASGSMYPEYEIGDILITKKVPASEIKIGDNVTYLGNYGDIKNLIITHKVQTIREEGDEVYYVTKGIANESYDPEIKYSQIYGKVIYKTKILSYISKMSTNLIIYIIVISFGLFISVQIVKRIFEEKLRNDTDEEEK